MMLKQTTVNMDNKDVYTYTNGNQFNLKWHQAYTKIMVHLVREHLIADDMALVDHIEVVL